MLNNILLICEDDFVMEHFKLEIEEKISPLSEILYSELGRESYQEILSIFQRLIDGKKEIPDFLLKDIKIISVIFHNSENSFHNLFQIMNQILIYGKSFIQHNLNILQMVTIYLFNQNLFIVYF